MVCPCLNVPMVCPCLNVPMICPCLNIPMICPCLNVPMVCPCMSAGMVCPCMNVPMVCPWSECSNSVSLSECSNGMSLSECWNGVSLSECSISVSLSECCNVVPLCECCDSVSLLSQFTLHVRQGGGRWRLGLHLQLVPELSNQIAVELQAADTRQMKIVQLQDTYGNKRTTHWSSVSSSQHNPLNRSTSDERVACVAVSPHLWVLSQVKMDVFPATPAVAFRLRISLSLSCHEDYY